MRCGKITVPHVVNDVNDCECAEAIPVTAELAEHVRGANFVLHAERVGLFTANREGILSSAGYLSPDHSCAVALSRGLSLS